MLVLALAFDSDLEWWARHRIPDSRQGRSLEPMTPPLVVSSRLETSSSRR